MDSLKDSHTAIFTGPTSCGKTQRVLDLLENEYRGHYHNIMILCPIIRWNTTCLERASLWKDPYVFLIDPKDQLFEWIAKLSLLLAGEESLFVVDDMISDEGLDKRRQSLLELAISGKHRKHSLWLLTQSYTAFPNNFRKQKKALFLWYPNERSDMKMIDEETNLIPDRDDIKANLKKSKHARLMVRLEHPRTWKILK
ncbi:uncharacterized protein LOC130625849 [Hydractinia symbiolongicarpus]|uniref:uncharacterized protein LOC130625849 n=1 Tax=Hydractinia symbiolongicarpus TaxID=13093 RepID=UPI00254F2318|nr:uncharacterized protein LOC130625849 [Hydractinia symbiolongicarpus]